MIVRRLLSAAEIAALLKRMATENIVETGENTLNLKLSNRFSVSGSTRQPHSEWSRWPADVFQFEPGTAQNFPGNASLIALDAPYYPSLDQVLSDFFGIRSRGWTNYFRGQVQVILPDFRARISKFTIAQACLTADLECRFSEPTDLVAKVYAENSVGRLLQETLHLKAPNLQFDLTDTPTLACIALVCASTKEVLDQRVFQQGTWQTQGVIVETPEEEIEQMLLTGESEALEFREKVDRSRPERLAKTVVAFANRKGGTILYGVDDDHRVVGCSPQDMADTITNIVRSYCEPPPEFSTRIVQHENKNLLLVQVFESSNRVHTVRDLGPIIRANGTNRSPNTHELEALFGRRSVSELMKRFS